MLPLLLTTSNPGPSLPPKVNDEVVGTLTIRIQECSVVDAFARIQFWGAQTFSDLHLNIKNDDKTASEEPAEARFLSSAVEYPLVGSKFALYKYLEDATPLQVRFLRNNKISPPEGNISNDALFQHELIGCASIPDLCFAELLRGASHNCASKKTRLSLRRELQIFSPGSDLNSSDDRTGKALFEVIFQFTGPTAVPQHLNESRKQGGSIPMNQMIRSPIEQDQKQRPRSPTNRDHLSTSQFSVHNSDIPKSITDDTVGLPCDLHTNSVDERQSLLEELLDLCNDDMTIPTIDSVPGFDPYDMWISRIVANASSPPVKEFPSLVSSGSHQSSVLQTCGLLKLEIDELILFSRIVSKIKGKNDLYLQYNLPPQASGPDKVNDTAKLSSGLIEFVVCEKFGTQIRTSSARRARPTALNKKDELNSSGANKRILASTYTNQMEVEFNDDDSVRRWIDGSIMFSLFYRALKPACHPKLPRVAMLADKRKKFKSVTLPGKVHIATARLRLRNLVLSDTLTSNLKLDLILSNNDELMQGVAEADTKVGSLSVHLGLHPVDKSVDGSVSGSPTQPPATLVNADERKCALRKPSSLLTPHPISIFLSNFAGASNNNASDAAPSENSKSPQRVQISQKEMPQSESFATNTEEPITHDSISGNKGIIDAPLKQVEAPPVWLHIRVECVSNLSVEAVRDKSASFQLCLSYNKPIWPGGEVTHQLHSEIISGGEILSLGSKAHLQGVVRLKADDSGVFSSNTVCSWQVALKAERKGDTKSIATLDIWHCGNNDDKSSTDKEARTLVGLANIPFLFDPNNGTQQNICNWLPGIAANGWFDVIDPKSHNVPIGKIQVLIAAGMQEVIRGFPEICENVAIVQRWWRKSRSNAKEEREAAGKIPPKDMEHCVIDLDSPAKENSNRYNDGLTYRASMEQMDDPASSPDSLFEEWSQQSLPVARGQDSNTGIHGDTLAIAEPAINQIHHGYDVSTSISGERVGEEESTQVTDINQDAEKVPTIAEEDNKTVGALDNDEMRTEAIKPAEEETATSKRTKCSNQIEIIVRLEKICGLREIVSTWIMQQRDSGTNSVLTASGIFVSYSLRDEKTTISHGEELRKLCAGHNVWHSKLVSAEAFNLDVELNLESNISIPNHETNTERVLTQMLEFKMWFVPIVTAAIAAMMNSKETKEMKILKGCEVISVATCPLYHIYTLEGCYKGKVPWNVAVLGDKNGNKNTGCILTSISRVSAQNPSHKHCVMSIIKPVNLEVSFTRGQDDCAPCVTGIDPPEEMKQAFKPQSTKRKINQSTASVREYKRYRCVKLMPHNSPPAMAKPLQEMSRSNTSQYADESETICASEASFGRDHDSQKDTTQTNRSLTGVLESLENTNSKTQQVGSFSGPQRKEYVSDYFRTSSSVCAKSDGTGGDPRRHKHCTIPAQHNAAAKFPDKLDSPRHQMEPPEENIMSETAAQKIAKSNKSKVDIVKTCEKGISPMSTTCGYVDAATSPCGGGSLVDDGIIEDEKVSNNDQHHPAEKHDADKLGLERCKCKNGYDDPMQRSQSILGLNVQKVVPRLQKSNRTTEGKNDPRLQYLQGYNSRRHLDRISKNYSSTITAPSCSLDTLGSRLFQHEKPDTSMLSPVLNSTSTDTLDICAKRACTGRGGTGTIFPICSRKHPTKLKKTIASIGNKDPHVSHKERLERIFQS